MAETREPFISCVVAIYNVEKYLEQCIRSLVEQDYEDIEIILVNDGSGDDSLSICRRFEQTDSRIRVINQENQGANIARNNGLYAASGRWVYFVDGDDFVTPDVFSAIVEYMTDDNDFVLFANSRYAKGTIRPISYPEDKLYFKRENGDFDELLLVTMDRLRDSRYNYRHFDAVSIWNKCYRREFLMDNDLHFIPKFPKVQDLTFNLQFYEKANRGVFVNHSGYVYRLNEGSVTKRYQKDFCDKLDVMERWFSDYAGRYDDEAMQEAYRKRLLTLLRSSIVLYFCNPNNPDSFLQRKQAFYSYVSREPFAEVLKRVDIRTLPIQEKMLSWFMIHHMFWGCELLNWLRNRMNG